MGVDSWLCYLESLEISWDLLGNTWNSLPQLQTTENEDQKLGSAFTSYVESDRIQMAIGADSLLCQLELVGISWKLNENIWNTPFHSFKILRRCQGSSSISTYFHGTW